MLCPKCSTQLQDGSAFCNKCGAPLQAAAPQPPPPPREEHEEILWTGRFSAKAVGHWWILWGLWVPALAYAYLFLIKSEDRSPFLRYVFLGAAGVPLVAILWHIAIRKLSLRYRLTSHRFFKESGIISRHVSELELIRVDDVSVRQNIIQRIFDVGIVTILSTDATDPRLDIEGIEKPIEVKEKLRTQVKQRRARTLHMESL